MVANAGIDGQVTTVAAWSGAIAHPPLDLTSTICVVGPRYTKCFEIELLYQLFWQFCISSFGSSDTKCAASIGVRLSHHVAPNRGSFAVAVLGVDPSDRSIPRLTID